MDPRSTTIEEEFVTIIGANPEEISRAFQAQGLADQHFAVVHRMGRHRFTMAEGADSSTLFDGRPLVAATYVRRHPG
ncbi:hypothetical protein MWN34_04115 [Ancylobacter sp. 6x-1]|uniref:Uncharacterized protein n=1 Tax=Ancylobacter crimeensis TaxID=2579147 RepID=A0ABT0D806_9HYPH|nr:hypothetical protein [Ancylobacter crimeensis]MCK0196093.1 hypothetical protein [Ancylobacter crimeensis]